MENTIHISIDTLEAILLEAKAIKEDNPGTSDIVKIVKIADRQLPEAEDKIETSLLTEYSETNIVEG